MIELIDYYKNNLPAKPFYSKDLGMGLRIAKRDIALKFKHIQHNQPQMVHWLVLDMDKYYFYEDFFNLPMPNVVAYNRYGEDHDCAHSHLFFALKHPVCRSDAARTKPLKYLAAIEHGLKTAFESDLNYSGLISKNFLHEDYRVQFLNPDLWELGEFKEWIDIPRKIPSQSESSGLGRNCDIFDRTRKIAYSEFHKYQNQSSFEKAVLDWCEEANSDYQEPLTINELKCIARSISKFCFKNMNKDHEQYIRDTHTSELQSERGKKNTSEQQSLKRKGYIKFNEEIQEKPLGFMKKANQRNISQIY